MRQYQKNGRNGIWLVLFCYWVGLLIWQNVRTVTNRGGLDIFIKALLLGILLVVMLFYNRSVRRDVLLLCSAYFLIVTASKQLEGILSISDTLYYYFPIVMPLLLCGVGGGATISKKQLLYLCNCVIVTVSYIALYALIFHTDSFLNAAQVDNAYGNELRSFLASSHEYGLYLAFGMIAVLLCLELSERIGIFLRSAYILALIIFAINLILTFSRTSIVSFFIMLLCYLFFFSKTKLRRRFFALVLAVVAVILLVRPLREYFISIVFKDNNDAGRGELLSAGWNMFAAGSLREKLFGYNRTYADQILRTYYGHMSFHNAYVQILVTNGLCGIAYFFTLIGMSAAGIYRTLKKCPQWSSLIRLLLGFLAASCCFMMTQTTILFSSSIDSYFISLIGIVLPLYVCNAMSAGSFGEAPQAVEKPCRSKYRRR